MCQGRRLWNTFQLLALVFVFACRIIETPTPRPTLKVETETVEVSTPCAPVTPIPTGLPTLTRSRAFYILVDYSGSYLELGNALPILVEALHKILKPGDELAVATIGEGTAEAILAPFKIPSAQVDFPTTYPTSTRLPWPQLSPTVTSLPPNKPQTLQWKHAIESTRVASDNAALVKAFGERATQQAGENNCIVVQGNRISTNAMTRSSGEQKILSDQAVATIESIINVTPAKPEQSTNLYMGVHRASEYFRQMHSQFTEHYLIILSDMEQYGLEGEGFEDKIDLSQINVFMAYVPYEDAGHYEELRQYWQDWFCHKNAVGVSMVPDYLTTRDQFERLEVEACAGGDNE